MDNKKTATLVLIGCVLMITLIIYSRAQRGKTPQENQVSTNVSQENTLNNEIQNQNTLEEDKVPENIVEDKKEEVEQDRPKQEEKVNKADVKQQEVQGEEETKDADAENSKNSQEKALDLVKEEWGEDDTVYYTIDNESGSIFNISVRSKQTTETLAEYEVNVEKQSINMR